MQDPYRCLEITVLKKPRSDEARALLERVAKQVQPIMRARQWTVKKVGSSRNSRQQSTPHHHLMPTFSSGAAPTASFILS
jgi:hypothetical protein